MNPRNEKAKYQFLVLSDLTSSSETTLLNAVHLAKAVGGEIQVFHVKSPTDVVTRANQLSAMREIHQKYNKTKARLEGMIQKIENQEQVSIGHHIAYGNVKNAIKERINIVKPDVIVLGKRKAKWLNLPGESITNFVLNNSKASLLIAGEDEKFHSYADISLGVLGENFRQEGLEIIKDLKRKNAKPIRLFSLGSDQKAGDGERKPETPEEKTISYVFSEGSNALNSMASYVLKTNTQLFCIPAEGSSSKVAMSNLGSQVRKMVQRLDIPVLVAR